ncbi:hypothetical protein COU57_05815 [Candidatus Pacearchaeota archaeon CG10_big_fil_rev_8_21_14_0_10_32_14]|nr:MAG: hypothetical protein COU57_05815 [Candidatus Pacearchaeota archaeon CG10_big_fil_rev_8_21_14_0_10_32_14]
MTTKYESADLILKIYELRREEKMREARDWFYGFNPKSIEEIQAIYTSEHSSKFRMVIGYWEMVAALINHQAIDSSMFQDTTYEHLTTFVKLQPFLPELRKGQPNFFLQLEKFIMNIPNAEAILQRTALQFVGK